MHISVRVPGALRPDIVEAAIRDALKDEPKHPIKIEVNPAEEVSVQITTCDFDPIARMHDIIAKIGEAIYAAIERAYAVVCNVPGLEGATWRRGAYTGFAG